jgi:MHS family proline/betaine transporter-like MFS transporter
VVGNVLEWYDFAVYGFLAPVIATQFFPSQDRTTSLLGAFGVFAGAYFMRPLGGVMFGHIGDRLGRKRALQLSVLLMALPTAAIGLLPTYASIGSAAAVLLVALRLLQGLSVGGELIGSISFITEISPPDRRGYYGSLALCSSTAGVLLGSMVALAIQELLGQQTLMTWGWRLPFLAGIGIGLFGLWMREGMVETPTFERMKREAQLERSPVREVLRSMPERIAIVAGLVVLTGGGFYMLFVWWPTLLTQLMDPPVRHSLLINSLAMTALMLAIPQAGKLSDAVGRRPVVIAGALGIAVAAHPLFHLVDHASFGQALLAQLLFAVLISAVTGPMPAMMVELFPARLRYSGVAVGYNISLAIFGGTAPLVSTWIVDYTGSVVAPSFYLVFLAVITFAAALSAPDCSQSIHQEELEQQQKARRPLVFPLPPPASDPSRSDDAPNRPST